MNLSGVVVSTSPDLLSRVQQQIDALQWAEVYHTDPDGRLIVVLEGEEADQEVARLKELQALPGVLYAKMVMHVFEDEAQQPPSQGMAEAEAYFNGEAISPEGGLNHFQRLKRSSNF